MLRSLTKWFSNIFEGAISGLFVSSLFFYVFIVFLLAVGIASNMDKPGADASLIANFQILAVVCLTIAEMFFIVALGISAAVVDIRNEVFDLNKELADANRRERAFNYEK